MLGLGLGNSILSRLLAFWLQDSAHTALTASALENISDIFSTNRGKDCLVLIFQPVVDP